MIVMKKYDKIFLEYILYVNVILSLKSCNILTAHQLAPAHVLRNADLHDLHQI